MILILLAVMPPPPPRFASKSSKQMTYFGLGLQVVDSRENMNAKSSIHMTYLRSAG